MFRAVGALYRSLLKVEENSEAQFLVWIIEHQGGVSEIGSNKALDSNLEERMREGDGKTSMSQKTRQVKWGLQTSLSFLGCLS